MDNELRIAILIDADNVSDKYIKIIVDEVANIGIATYKRIYGDWTSARLSSWKNVLLEDSIIPIQQYSYTTGKNATDSAMIIDAMDILYSGNVDGYCIVSSDSDFTRLAARLRESGMLVLGMGEEKTPKPFISACNQFKYLDLLYRNQQEEEKKQDEEKTVETAATVTQHFDKSSAVWPIEGDVLLDYSMDSTIYFPTLEQYRCNPAMVISGNVNDKVFAMATGKITDIQENEETGCTVIQDLGDGYAAVYGQLKELNFAKGDTPEAGQVLGYVSEPTKYYTTEGSNVYFQLKKDGKAVDPKEYLPQMAMDTLD